MTDTSRYFADENSPFSCLEAKAFFDTLSGSEKKYAHFMSRASFEGTRIIIAQTNPGALPIYELILTLFSNEKGEMVQTESLFQSR
jgi:dipeptidyl-peptidase-3